MQSGSRRVASSGVTYPMLVTLSVFQVLMSLLNVDTQLLCLMRPLMSVTRDTYKTKSGCEGQGVPLVMGEDVADSMKNGCICGSLHPRC